MSYVSDKKFADDMGLSVTQVRKMIKRLDIPFFSAGKGVDMVYMFETDELNDALMTNANQKKDRKRGPRKQHGRSTQIENII